MCAHPHVGPVSNGWLYQVLQAPRYLSLRLKFFKARSIFHNYNNSQSSETKRFAMTVIEDNPPKSENTKKTSSPSINDGAATKVEHTAAAGNNSSSLEGAMSPKSPLQASHDVGETNNAQSPTSPQRPRRLPLQMESSENESSENWADEFSEAWEMNVAQPGRKALHDFFYPPRQQHSEHQSQGGLDRSTTDRETAPETSGQGRQYPSRQDSQQTPSSTTEEDTNLIEQDREDREYVEGFWTAYDEIIILSLFTQIGILCRLGVASWFQIFDAVFRADRALFTNLPLNCLSCFAMGLLCSGESLMQIISTRFTPPRLQHDLHREAQEASEDEDDDFGLPSPRPPSSATRWRGKRRSRRRKRRRQNHRTNWKSKHTDLQNELREVQLLALERRIRASPCLVLFPVKKTDGDLVENYFNDGYQQNSRDEVEEKKEEVKSLQEEISFESHQALFSLEDHDLVLSEAGDINDPTLKDEEVGSELPQESATETREADESFDLSIERHQATRPAADANGSAAPTPHSIPSKVSALSGEDVENRMENKSSGGTYSRRVPRLRSRQYSQLEGGNVIDYGTADNPDLDQIISNVATDVSQKISRMGRVRLADGWAVRTTPQEKSEDLMLGLRDGLCGALSSFSSWISTMVRLLRGGQFTEAFVGLLLGIQLPIIAYRFGQHVAVYIFVWRCRRETRRDERRGYGIRLNQDEEMDEDEFMSRSNRSVQSAESSMTQNKFVEIPSVRAIITALFIMAIAAQATSLYFFYNPEDRLVALSLLFSPLGVLSRWKLSQLNSWRPNFPIGTFMCNIGACALSGTLGSLLAGNPGPRERIALVSIIAGFGGTLSSVARFIVEILNGMDPILFRIDGVYYAVSSVFWGLLVSFVFSASVDWADSVERGGQ